ncbi:hypothetical protein [Pleurocapsa sp. PCC 7319]|uniref:hypothetical protein n=1 Tax=Pleurocapsa sp. PCC 7319 TaxID=118161 RepID=UPI00034B6988|nr:hypothetical protein [Pleurocapsa sp. PCC 7319]
MKKITVLVESIALSSVILTSCESKNDNQTIATTTDKGTLTLVANGEDFVRQGFVSKDGWQINFDHLYVNISEATAYQADSSFQPQKGDTKDSFKYQDRVEFINIGETTDLASGDANSAPILVAKTDDAPVGFYNVLTWKLSTA